MYLLHLLRFQKLILCLFMFTFSNCNKIDSFQKLLASHGISISTSENFNVSKNKYINQYGYELREIIAKTSNDVIKLRIIYNQSLTTAKKYIHHQTTQLDSLFHDYYIPYSGQISNTIRCKNFLPLITKFEREEMFGIRYYLFSNDRYLFGACSETLLKYKTSLILFYCAKENIVYEFSFFTPKDNINPNFEKITNYFKTQKCTLSLK